MGGILDRLAAAEIYPELDEIPTKQVFKGFKKSHVAVGTNDADEQGHPFWYYDTEETLDFLKMMGLYGFLYMLFLWCYLAHTRWTYTDENRMYNSGFQQNKNPLSPGYVWNSSEPLIERLWIPLNPINSFEQLLSRVHLICLTCGWTVWILVGLSVTLHQFFISSGIYATDSVKMVDRTSDCPWLPRHNLRPGLVEVPIHETKPRPFSFSAPITNIRDGNCLYCHHELIQDAVFGDTVPEKLKEMREKFRIKMYSKLPSSVGKAVSALVSQRKMYNLGYRIDEKFLYPGRYFIDEDVPPREDDVMRGKELRRIVWWLLWPQTFICAAAQNVRYFAGLFPPMGIYVLMADYLGLVMSMAIFWTQYSKWGAKKLENWDRNKDDTENVFSKKASHEW